MSMYSYCMFMYLHRASWQSSATLTEVFTCFFLSCKTNARVEHAKLGRGPHSSKILCCYTYCLFCVFLCTVCLEMCIVLLPPVATKLQLTNVSYRIICSSLDMTGNTRFRQLTSTILPMIEVYLCCITSVRAYSVARLHLLPFQSFTN
jgi:hypothetical protein